MNDRKKETKNIPPLFFRMAKLTAGQSVARNWRAAIRFKMTETAVLGVLSRTTIRASSRKIPSSTIRQQKFRRCASWEVRTSVLTWVEQSSSTPAVRAIAWFVDIWFDLFQFMAIHDIHAISEVPFDRTCHLTPTQYHFLDNVSWDK